MCSLHFPGFQDVVIFSDEEVFADGIDRFVVNRASLFDKNVERIQHYNAAVTTGKTFIF
jgi:hypothetical protein